MCASACMMYVHAQCACARVMCVGAGDMHASMCTRVM